jgi:UDP-glucose 4-epimerase
VYGEAGVIAIFCGRLASGVRPTVFGDGSQTRDWVDVSDVARANLRAADAGADLTGPVNIGTGREISVLEVLGTLARVWGGDRGGERVEPEFAPPRAGEVQRSCLDVTRAREALGWEAQVGLEDGLRAILAAL